MPHFSSWGREYTEPKKQKREGGRTRCKARPSADDFSFLPVVSEGAKAAHRDGRCRHKPYTAVRCGGRRGRGRQVRCAAGRAADMYAENTPASSYLYKSV